MLETQTNIETTKNHDIQLGLNFDCRLGWFLFVLPCSVCFELFMTAGHIQAGASSDQGSLVKYMTPKMDERRRSFAALRYAIRCCINRRPEQMRFDDGFQLFVGALAPEYVHTAMAKETFNSVLGTLYDRVKKNVLDDLRSFREECFLSLIHI